MLCLITDPRAGAAGLKEEEYRGEPGRGAETVVGVNESAVGGG